MRSGWVVALSVVGSAALAGAQTHVVKKPETVVRAVGVFEWTGELDHPTANRLVPVSVFINGQLEDAGVYLARPVPLALETGTVFELDKSGVADGTVELAYARHYVSNGVAAVDDGWLGYGAYKGQPVVKLAKLKAGKVSPVEVSGGTGKTETAKTETSGADPDRPTMTRRTGSGTAGGSDAGSGAKPADDPDRPTMTRRSGSDPDAASTPAAGPDAKSGDDTATAKNAEAERPTLQKRTEAQRVAARKESNASSVAGVGSIEDDPDRPNLHRGKPVGRMDEAELPPLKGIPAGMQQMVAVSDAKNRSEHSFARDWEDDAERVAVLGKMQGMARAKLASYEEGVRRAAASVAAKPVAKSPQGAARGKKPVASPAGQALGALTDEVLRGFTLSYGGAATYFYSATQLGADAVPRYVTVVAQREPDGSLKIALASVTDAGHLDRTPQMRLVDAVDAEASNRASLLLELRGQDSRVFGLYRVIGAEAEQTLVTAVE